MKVKKTVIAGLLLALFAGIAQADSLTSNQIAQQIRQGSVLSLRQNVAGFWADNLLAAQDPSVCDYCAFEADSLPLSIAAVLKAIRIEADPIYGAGLSFCNLTNCTIANTQSTIAVDDRVSVVITPAALDFGEVPVATPEPSVFWFLALGTIVLFVVRFAPHPDSAVLTAGRFRCTK